MRELSSIHNNNLGWVVVPGRYRNVKLNLDALDRESLLSGSLLVSPSCVTRRVDAVRKERLAQDDRVDFLPYLSKRQRLVRHLVQKGFPISPRFSPSPSPSPSTPPSSRRGEYLGRIRVWLPGQRQAVMIDLDALDIQSLLDGVATVEVEEKEPPRVIGCVETHDGVRTLYSPRTYHKVKKAVPFYAYLGEGQRHRIRKVIVKHLQRTNPLPLQ